MLRVVSTDPKKRIIRVVRLVRNFGVARICIVGAVKPAVTDVRFTVFGLGWRRFWPVFGRVTPRRPKPAAATLHKGRSADFTATAGRRRTREERFDKMRGTSPRLGYIAAAILLVSALAGCTARYSVPAQCFPSALYYAPRSSQEPINFIHLRRDPPPVYMLGPRDVLGIYVEGVLGKVDKDGVAEPPPVHFPERGDLPPAVGYPIPIREDGTISLPLVPPIHATGLTLAQVEEEIRKAYTVTQQILPPGRERILVTLMRPRTYQVLVIREDTTSPSIRRGSSQGQLILGAGKRGMTYVVELPAYENDVLHALSESGGLPGVDAKNEITILRGAFSKTDGPESLPAGLVDADDGANVDVAALFEEVDESPVEPEILLAAMQVESSMEADDPAPSRLKVLPPDFRAESAQPENKETKIPLRAAPDEPFPELTEDDIILHAGDIVFIESREAEVFYTGGLLKGGQFPIPRDYDLDVLGAIAMAGGSVAAAVGGSGGQGALGGGYRAAVGSIFPPTRALVVRTVNGRQTVIQVDLKRAVLDPRERILIVPNDFILLEYKPHELVLNVLLNNVQLNYFLNNLK